MAAPTGKSPSEFIANYSSDGTNITIPIASLTGLTAELAHGLTGDIRAVLMAILDTLKGGVEAGPMALGDTGTVALSPETQNSGLLRKTYTVRIIQTPAAYAFADPVTNWVV